MVDIRPQALEGTGTNRTDETPGLRETALRVHPGGLEVAVLVESAKHDLAAESLLPAKGRFLPLRFRQLSLQLCAHPFRCARGRGAFRTGRRAHPKERKGDQCSADSRTFFWNLRHLAFPDACYLIKSYQN